MNKTTYPTIGFIGAGNMASAIIGGLLAKGYPAEQLWASDPSAERLQQVKHELNIQVSADNTAVVSCVDVLVFAVKPQVLGEVAKSLQSAIAKKQPLVVSIAAGIMSTSVSNWLGGGRRQ